MGFDMENVLQAIRRREQGVFKQLFESYFKKMTLFAEYFLLDRGEAEDIVQEVFIDLWNNAPTLPEVSNLKSYLFTQVRNRSLNRLKHLHVEDNYKQWLLEAQAYAEIPEVEIDQDMLKKVYDVIEELPDQSKIIFKRCVLDGKKYKEVAEEMNISVNTVNTQMSRAYKFIRSRLGASFLILLSVIYFIVSIGYKKNDFFLVILSLYFLLKLSYVCKQ